MLIFSHPNQSRFLKNGFALRLHLKQRHKGTQKWPIIMHEFKSQGEPPDVMNLSDIATVEVSK